MHPEDFAEMIIAHLKLNRRVFVKEASIWSTNPWCRIHATSLYYL